MGSGLEATSSICEVHYRGMEVFYLKNIDCFYVTYWHKKTNLQSLKYIQYFLPILITLKYT